MKANAAAARPQRVRMVDVAREAGVSQPTASRVLSGDPKVTAANRDAVLAAAQRMGYVLNHAASSLASNRTNSVGFVIAEPGSHLWGNPYFPRLMAGITTELNARRQQLVLFMAHTRRDQHQLLDYLLAGHVDGVLMTTSRNRDPLLTALLQAQVPVVVGGRPLGVPDAVYVDVDNEHAGHTATTHLLSAGYTRVATIAGPQSTAAGKDRLRGYRRAITDAGGERREVVAPDFGYLAGETAAAHIFQRWPDTDAIFAAGDSLVYGALTTLKIQGKQCPTDIGLIGFDDSEPTRHTTPPLSSIAQPVEELGRLMVTTLLDRTQDAPTPDTLSTRLVARTSSQRSP